MLERTWPVLITLVVFVNTMDIHHMRFRIKDLNEEVENSRWPVINFVPTESGHDVENAALKIGDCHTPDNKINPECITR
jgi:hypothetical protein